MGTHLRRALLCCWLVLAAALPGLPAMAQDVNLVDRPVTLITLMGLDRVGEQTVRNNIRSTIGDPYDPEVVRGDVRRLTRLGEFKFVDVSAELRPDGTVEVVYRFTEQRIITAVQVVGNKLISDQELLAVVKQYPNLARDDYLIQDAQKRMEELYKKRGHYLTTVEIDETELDRSGILLFRIIEGPRVKIKAIAFEGNDVYRDKRLSAEVKTRAAVPFFRSGALDEDALEQDLVAIDAFYKDRGYLDIRVGRRIELSPNNREAKVVFLVEEGRQYVLRHVKTENGVTGGALTVFAPEQIAAMLEIKAGDAFSEVLIRRSRQIISDAYGRLGYLNVRVNATESRTGDGAEADLLLSIDEGERANVGVVRVKGNFLTRDKVVRRLVRLEPGRPYDGSELARSKQRIEQTRLFNEVRLTVQPPDPENPDYRDLLVEIKERNTGSVNFGLAVGSDNGLFGSFSVQQDNFDIADFPDSFGEFVNGAAFRGAGQKFAFSFLPGTEVSQFNISLTEPHLFESDNSATIASTIRTRDFDIFDEDRFRNVLSIGRRVGDYWSIGVNARYERVELTDIRADAPVDIFLDRGPDNLAGLGVSITRTTVPTLVRPGKGSRLRFNFERVGIFGEDVEFNRAELDYSVFLTLDEDLLGRRTTLRLDSRFGYIFGGRAPTYERFYMGGRSFRGFEFRTISPKGIDLNGDQTDEPVGGNWLFFLGGQVEFPLFAEAITGVVFIDTGTVTEDVGFDPYRVAVGTGIRLSIPQLGPVPIAFDLGFPIVKDDLDEEQVFSFRVDVPF